MAAITAAELIWWLAAWLLHITFVPHFAAYLLFAMVAMAAATALRVVFGLPMWSVPWPVAVTGTFLVGVGASAFLPLKYAIPREVPFWLDRPIALAERAVFRGDPWLLLDHLLGWAARPMDWLYGGWLPVQSLVLLLLVLSRPSPAKSRALIAYALAWFLLGLVAAVLLSSAGPLFYDRLFGGGSFSGLATTLRARGAVIALGESDRMWASFGETRPGLVAGISAVPSIHVAISLWMFLTARSIMPRAKIPALAYFLLVWIGSVQLGWHYVIDGLAGALGLLAVWALSKVPSPPSSAGEIDPQQASGQRQRNGDE